MTNRTGLVLLPLGLLLAGCKAPGEGDEASLGFRRAGPLIAALGAYRADHGQYPSTLHDLVGAYVPAAALAGPEGDAPFEYRRAGEVYELGFEYTGSGKNWCTFTLGSPDWECDGIF